MMPTIDELLRNEGFTGLPLEEKRKVINQTFPDFLKTPIDEKRQVFIRNIPQFAELPHEEQFKVLEVFKPPPPTFMESVKESFGPRNLLRQAGPAGMMIGGAIGAASPVPGGALLGSGLGGALGTGAQQLGEQYLLGDQPKAPEQILTEQLQGGEAGVLGEMGGQIVGTTLGGAYGLGKEIAKEGIGPTFARRTAKVPQWALDVLDIFPGSRLFMNKYRSELNKWMINQRAEMVKEYISAVSGKGEVGAKVGSELAEKYGETGATYKKFTEAPGDVPITRARQIVHQHGIERDGKIWYGQYEDDAKALRDILDHETATPEKISEWLGGTKNKYNAVKSPELKDKLRKAFYQDLAQYDSAMGTNLEQLKRNADDLYAMVRKELDNNPALRKVLQDYAPQRNFPGLRGTEWKTPAPDRIMRDIFESGSPEMTKKILKALPDDTQNLLIGNWLEDMISSSMDKSKKYLYPYKWQEVFNRNRNMIANVAPDILPKMDKWTKTIRQGAEQLPSTERATEWVRPALGVVNALSAGPAAYFAGLSAGPLAGPAIVAGIQALPTVVAWGWMGDGAKRLFQAMGRSGIPQLATKMATFEMEKE